MNVGPLIHLTKWSAKSIGRPAYDEIMARMPEDWQMWLFYSNTAGWVARIETHGRVLASESGPSCPSVALAALNAALGEVVDA